MRIIWVDIVGEESTGDWLPLDVGVMVSTGPEEDFEVLGYGGWAVEHPLFETVKDAYPEIALVNSLIPAEPIESVEENLMTLVDRHVGPEDDFVVVHRAPLRRFAHYLPLLVDACDEGTFFNMGEIETVMDFLGVPSMYWFDPANLPERATSRAIYYHAEALTYRNNIQSWGNEMLQANLDACLDDLDAMQEQVESVDP